MPPWPWPGYLIFFLLPGGQRWWPTEAQAWWVRQQLGDFMQRFAHLLCSLARNVFPRKPITIPLQNGKKIHWNMWKSGKIRKTKVQHLSKSALQSFVAPLLAPAAPAQGCCCWMESRLSALKPPAPPRACCFCFWGSGPAQLVVAVKRCWECGTHCLKNIIYIYTINNV